MKKNLTTNGKVNKTTLEHYIKKIHYALYVSDSSKDKPLKTSELLKKMEESLSERTLRRIVRYARLEGYPIVSNGKGYWWGNEQDVKDFISNGKKMIKNQKRMLKKMK